MDFSKKVSVVIPTYKRDVSLVSRALSSVQNQTYKNLEIIVVDDSPDSFEKRQEVCAYVLNAAKADSRVIYLKNEKNLGGSLARNRGIDVATGEYITFLDDDDEYKPQKVEKQVEYMNSHGCDLTFSNMIMYNNSGKIVDARDYRSIESFDNSYLLKYHLMHHMTGTPTFMYRAHKLKEIGGFEDAIVGQEFYLMLKSIERGLKIGYIDDCDVKVYRDSDEMMSSGKRKITGEKYLFEFKKKYFDILTPREIRAVKFRYYAVMVVVYIRNSMYFKAAASAVKAFFSSPADFFVQVFGYLAKVIKHRKNS